MSRTLRTAATAAAVAVLAACSASSGVQPSGTSSSGTRAATSTAPLSTSRSTSERAPQSTASSSKAAKASKASKAAPRPASTSHQPTTAAQGGSALPLQLPTGNARQVITVTARSASSTSAILQAWQRTAGAWHRSGPAVTAWLGSAGFSRPASEGSTATPRGSFGLTQAFGSDSDPGTALPYTKTSPADWWISQAGPLYNTLQHCSSGCAFTQGSPNEHLYYAQPFYQYAVVIDYNRDPAVAGKGSAFFLHVSVGEPTQGCVSIERDQLVRLMRWLQPSEHPRILLGTG